MIQTSETCVKSYSIDDLNKRYPDKPWFVPFDIETYDFSPKTKGIRSKFTNGYLTKARHPDDDIDEQITPTLVYPMVEKVPKIIRKKKDIVIMIEEPKNIISEEIKIEQIEEEVIEETMGEIEEVQEVTELDLIEIEEASGVSLNEKRVRPNYKDMDPVQREQYREKKREWHISNRDKVNARRRARRAEKNAKLEGTFVKKNLNDYPPRSIPMDKFTPEEMTSWDGIQGPSEDFVSDTEQSQHLKSLLRLAENTADQIFTIDSTERIIRFRQFNETIPVSLIIHSHLLRNGHSEEKLQKVIDSIKEYMGK